MKVSSVIYQIFYTAFRSELIRREYKGNEKTDKKIWDEDSERIIEKVYNGKRFKSPWQFYLKSVELNPKMVLIGEINDDILHCALKYLDQAGPAISGDEKTLLQLLNEFAKKNATQIANQLNQQKQISYNFFESQFEKLNNEVEFFEANSLHTNKSEDTNLAYKIKDNLKSDHLINLASEILLGKKYWFFFYSYDNYKDKSETWKLRKLLIEFTEVVDSEILVRINHIADKKFQDYLGKTNLSSSSDDVVVIDCQTFSKLKDRHLDIMVQLNDGELLFGQYLNYRKDGRIVSGSLLLQKIPAEQTNLTPETHLIPRLLGDLNRYTEDVEGIDKSIIQYFHDENLNFRQISLRAGNDLNTLKEWLDYHYQ